MQPARALVGAIVGAALGIALLYIAYRFAGRDEFWLSIPFAFLTGLGVRFAIAGTARASYLRGAMTAVLALAAYLGGWFIVAAVARHRAADVAKPHIPASAEVEPGASADAKDAMATAAPAAEPAPVVGAPQTSASNMRPGMARQYSPWDIISLAVAALIAYELGRGSDKPSRPLERDHSPEAVPAGAHPDA